MKAVIYSRIRDRPQVAEVPDPPCPRDGVVVAVRATGLCRSDWHAWQGHEVVPLPHVPGHEFAGVIDEVGADVRGWAVGDRVTAPFVYACGQCVQCTAGDHQVCDQQEQPGFTRWGSFAERVVVTRAETNLVRLPDVLDFAAAASLGCRFATAYRAVVDQGRLAAGETLLVSGCGGLGLAAIQIGIAVGAQVVGVDPFPAARAAAEELGARSAATAAEARDLVGGAHLALDAYGSAESAVTAYGSLGKRGRYVQVGLLTGRAAYPQLDLGRAIAEELEIRGSHGMAAHAYPALLARVVAGELDPGAGIGRRVRLDELPDALVEMSAAPSRAGFTIAELQADSEIL
jgi:alcohol dehydrogenase